MKGLQPETCIDDQSTGFLVLAIAVIMQAVEDIQLALEFPEFGKEPTQSKDSHKAQIRFKCRTVERQTKAKQAAEYLTSKECRETCELLRACGYPVPLKRLFKELAALKEKGAAHHG